MPAPSRPILLASIGLLAAVISARPMAGSEAASELGSKLSESVTGASSGSTVVNPRKGRGETVSIYHGLDPRHFGPFFGPGKSIKSMGDYNEEFSMLRQQKGSIPDSVWQARWDALGKASNLHGGPAIWAARGWGM